MTCTVDANVFVAAARPEEVHYKESREFLQEVARRGITIVCPALVLAECSAALARATDSTENGVELAEIVEGMGNVQFVALESSWAHHAARVAASHRLRGADAIYCTVAKEAGATLITWDAELLERGAAAVRTMTPAEWLAAQQDNGTR